MMQSDEFVFDHKTVWHKMEKWKTIRTMTHLC